jgi:hypothetical protein
MAAKSSPQSSLSPIKVEIPSTNRTLAYLFIVIGLATFAVGLLTEPTRTWVSYLTSFWFFLSLGMGGLFFTAIQHVTNSQWSTTVRRYSEALTSFLPWAALLGLLLVFGGSKYLYIWLDPEVVAGDALIQKKVGYLNQGFFIVRALGFFGLWLLFRQWIVSKSLKQDQTGDSSLTAAAVKPSVIFLMVFAITYSLFSVDLLMSLDPHWYSTMFGVYCFAGLFQSSLAMIILITVWLMKRGALRGYVNENHLHDLGKLLFAFTVFYAYIGFSQFMLIWYANLPEETLFFKMRSVGAWWNISMLLLVMKFVVPFLVLLPRGNKRNPKVLVPAAILLLVMQYVDNYWLIYPNFNEGMAAFSIWEIGIFLGMLGGFLLCIYRFLSKYSVVPVGDPRLEESTHHHT